MTRQQQDRRELRRAMKAYLRAQAFALLQPGTRAYLMRTEEGWFRTFAGQWFSLLKAGRKVANG